MSKFKNRIIAAWDHFVTNGADNPLVWVGVMIVVGIVVYLLFR